MKRRWVHFGNESYLICLVLLFHLNFLSLSLRLANMLLAHSLIRLFKIDVYASMTLYILVDNTTSKTATYT